MLAGLVLLLIALGAAEAWFLVVAEADPYGVGGAAPITAADLPQVDALYGLTWTPMRWLAWSPDGRFIALGDWGALMVIDAVTGGTVSEWAIPGDVTALSWSPHNATIAVGVDTTGGFREGWIFLYDLRGIPTASWRVTSSTVGGIAWSADGSRLLTASPDEYAMWTPSGTELYHWVNVTTHGTTASWSPDGTRIAVGGQGSPLIIDAATGAPVWVTANGSSCEVAWSPRGDLIAAGFDSGEVALYTRGGAEVRSTRLNDTGWMFGSPVSWNADGTLVAVPTTQGLAILSASHLAVVRTLVFPISDFLPGGGGMGTLDWNVAWSPRGELLAATGTTSSPSFRLWGVRAPALGGPLLLIGVLGAFGLALILRRDVRALRLNPDRVGMLWARTDAELRTGQGLFGFAIASSILYSYDGYVLDRIYGVGALPSLGWIFVSILLTVPVVVLAAMAAADAFHAVLWPALGPRPFAGRSRRVFGYLLLPTLLAAGLAHLLLGAALALVPTVSSDGFNLLFDGLFGVVLGVGFYLSLRVAGGLPWARARRSGWALLASVGASVLVLFAFLMTLVVALNLLQVQPAGGEFTRFGFTILLGFGFVPFVVALIGLATVTASAGIVFLIRFLPGGYARVRGSAILELEARRKILEMVTRQPGLHFRALLRTSGFGSGTLHYHLDVLEREGYVTARREGRTKKFYPSPAPPNRPWTI